MGDWFWVKLCLVESFGVRIMFKKFQGKWDPLSCTCFTMPPCCIQTLGINCVCLANQMVVDFDGDKSYDHVRLHKKFHQQWLKENGTPFTKLQSAPTDK